MPRMSEQERQSRKAQRSPGEAGARDRTKESDRLSVPIDAEGRIDLSKMQAGNREKLRRALAGLDVTETPETPRGEPAAAVAPGATAPGADPADELWSEVQIREVLRVVGMVQAGIAMRVWGVPAGVARDLASFNEKELDALTPPATRVSNKYSPAWAKKYRDELALLAVFGGIFQSKTNALNQWVTEHVPGAASNAQRPPATGPRPAPAPAATGTDDARTT